MSAVRRHSLANGLCWLCDHDDGDCDDVIDLTILAGGTCRGIMPSGQRKRNVERTRSRGRKAKQAEVKNAPEITCGSQVANICRCAGISVAVATSVCCIELLSEKLTENKLEINRDDANKSQVGNLP